VKFFLVNLQLPNPTLDLLLLDLLQLFRYQFFLAVGDRNFDIGLLPDRRRNHLVNFANIGCGEHIFDIVIAYLVVEILVFVAVMDLQLAFLLFLRGLFQSHGFQLLIFADLTFAVLWV